MLNSRIEFKFYGTTVNVDDENVTLNHGRLRRMGGVPKTVETPLGAITAVNNEKPKGGKNGSVEIYTASYNPTGPGRPQQIIYTAGSQASRATELCAILNRHRQASAPASTPSTESTPASQSQPATYSFQRHDATLEGWKLDGDTLFGNGQAFSLAGAKAEFETGANIGGRMTATRVIGGGLLFGPAGAIVGGMWKKNRAKVYIVITDNNGRTGLIETSAKNETKAREFANAVNNVARQL
ncbi:hypothetical protein [Brevibacterium renqingii]|uniref:hypothetical protein n=1 Tax=Brevibacterium renqingii TaxID=2776916 RepID=UPI001AE0C441|nr:hypothetical protein [Brevibacterium renqingii]